MDELKAGFKQWSKIIWETVKFDKQTDKKVLEIPYRENLLLKREQYKVENGVIWREIKSKIQNSKFEYKKRRRNEKE